MGACDFTCCACGAGRGSQGEHMYQFCSATILVKEQDAAGQPAWSPVTIQGVYNGHGVILVNKDGRDPYEYAGGRHFNPPYPQSDPKAPKAVTEYLLQKWKEECIPTVSFYCTQFSTLFQSWKVKPGDFVAFDVKCAGCMSAFGPDPLPPLDRLETLAEFHTRLEKTAAHEALTKARAQLEEHAALAKRAQEALDKAQEVLDKARAAVDCSKQTLAKTQAEVFEAQSVLDGCGAHVRIVKEKEPPKKRQRRAYAHSDSD